MKYQSTRGGRVDVSFKDVVMSGYAPDDGMYMPMELPKLPEGWLENWANLSYIELVKELSKLFIEDEIPGEKIDELIDTAFQSFEDPANPLPIKSLKDDLSVLEMYHGKSLAFKDLSMCCTAQFLSYFLEEADTTATLLISTSGDTGSSALEAMSTVARADIVVVLPKDRISDVQERQMTSVVADNCHVIRADGSADEVDQPIRKIFSDEEAVKKYKLGTLNSVNWCRLLVQIAHHFYSYFQGKKLNADKETIVFIPTGGLGNSTAGCIAREMGLPLRMGCAVTNDAFHRAVYDCEYSITDLVVSMAPAINIQMIYNFERVLYLLSGMDTDLVKKVQEDYAAGEKVVTPEVVVNKLKEFLEVVLVKDEEIIDAIKRCSDENDYVLCPHTAAAMAAAYGYENASNYNVIVYGVASPAKFTDSLEKAGVEWKGRDLAAELRDKEVKYTDWELDVDWSEKLVQLLDSIVERRASI